MLRLQHQADRLSVLSVVEGECLLAPHMEQQISLSYRAAKHDLNGIHTASVIFSNADDLFIFRKLHLQQFHCVQRRLIADCQATADMAMKCGAFFPEFLILIVILHG